MGAGADVAALVGRLAMSALFFHSGFNKAMAAKATIAMFARQGVPAPEAVFVLALIIELAVAAALVVGWKVRWSAFILAAWCVATALFAHYRPGDRGQMIHFLKNIAMAGGFLQIMAFGPGRFSIDRR